jgi:Methyltransferase FkbM domain
MAQLTVCGPMTSTLEPRPGSAIDVQTMTIDSFVAQHPGIDVALIKTDIEGHDMEALKGMTRTVERFQPLILSECGHEPQIMSLLRGWGYRAFAYVCDRRSLKLSFQELTAESLQSAWYKMIFLTPSDVGIDAFAYQAPSVKDN